MGEGFWGGDNDDLTPFHKGGFLGVKTHGALSAVLPELVTDTTHLGGVNGIVELEVECGARFEGKVFRNQTAESRKSHDAYVE